MDSRWHSRSISAGICLAYIIYLILIVIVASACASTGQDIESAITVPRTVRHVASLDARLAPHYHLFVSILKSNGLEVGKTDDPRALQLRLELVPNPRQLEVVASLWQEETALINVKGLSGDIASRSSAHVMSGSAPIGILAQRAAIKFEKKFIALRPNLVIVPDSPPSDVIQAN